jgi:hypothetical protein
MTDRDATHVHLRIGRLVLPAAWAGAERRVAAALESELARLVAERGLPAALDGTSPIARLDAGRVPPAAGARRAGADLARAVYRGLAAGPPGGA